MMTSEGKTALGWYSKIKFFATWAFYFHIVRVIINFLKVQGSLPGKYHTYGLIGSMVLIYGCVALLVLSMWRLQAIDLYTDKIVTDNTVLTYTIA